MDSYHYEPLPYPTSIRLIKFDETQTSDVISGRLVIADTSDPPQYIALSYVWGDATDRVSIVLDGRAVQVTRNLHNALRAFSKTPTLLWADALCINQLDIPERNQQVNMMSTIYRKAANVSVWLGPDEHSDAPVLFGEFKKLVEGCGVILDSGGQLDRFDEETGDLHWRAAGGQVIVSPLPTAFVNPSEEEKARLERFLRLEWFSRTWVLQEVGLAADAVVLWGGLAIEWAPIGLTAMFLTRYCRVALRKIGLIKEVEQIFHIYTAFSPFAPQRTFFHILNIVRECKATDPRDKVFALLSHPTAHTITFTTISLNWNAYKAALPMALWLATSIHDQFILKSLAEQRSATYAPEALPPALWKADYNKSTKEVYHHLALDLIQRTRSLEILTAVQNSPEDPANLFKPSWVPRWDYNIGTPIMGLYHSNHRASAKKDVILTPSPTDSPDYLIVRGRLITRITTYTKLLVPSSFDLPLPAASGPDTAVVQRQWDTNPVANTWLLQFRDQHPESYPVYPSMMTESGYAIIDKKASNLYTAYMRTWVAGKNMGEIDGFDLEADSEAYWERLFWGAEGEAEKTPAAESQPRWQRYRDAAAEICNHRRFFLTKKGLCGLGPGAMMDGDFVAVLLGADVPFVIREVVDEDEGTLEERMRANKSIPMDRKFTLVGECYVDGIMQGQSLQGVETVRDITLI